MRAHRIGAVSYGLWGVAHVAAGWHVYQLALGVEPGLVQGRLFQDAAFLLLNALVAVAVAAALNWRNSRLGWWLNLTCVSITDVAFLVGLVLPGFVPLPAGLVGPALWLTGLAATTLGLRRHPVTD